MAAWWAASGFSSLFSFCTDRWHFTSSAAYRRTTAARLLARFPVIADYLASGRLCLTTLVALRDVLDEETHLEVLDRASGLSEEQVKVLVATIRPQPAPRDLIRALPTPEPVNTAGPAVAPPEAVRTAGAAAAPVQPSRLEPLSAELTLLRLTVDREFMAELAEVRALLSHRIPDRQVGKVLRECLRIARKTLAARRRGGEKPRPPKTKMQPQTAQPAVRPSRRIPAAVRREVWVRDGARCAYLAPDGKRCGSDHQLELHHLVPFAKGGPSTAPNIALRCRIHNHHQAELDYGAEHMAAFSGRTPSTRTDPQRPGT